MLSDEYITKLRKKLENELKNYNSDKKIKLNIDNKILDMILFDKNYDFLYKAECKCFAISFDLIKKLDLSDFSFNSVNIKGKDFTGSIGANLDPQTIYDKDMSWAKVKGLDFSDKNFDNVSIGDTNFTGSIGAKINPQNIKNKHLDGTNLTDTEIIGSLDGVSILATTYKGKIISECIKKEFLNTSEEISKAFQKTKTLEK